MSGDLLSVPGLRGAAVATGVKQSGKLDLALIAADGPRTAAAVFTRNALPAAPIQVCRELLRRSRRVHGVVINSGNANAMTGAQGLQDAWRMAERAAAACGGPALVLSTGVIGVPLPAQAVLDGIARAGAALSSRGGASVAQAMLTTDTGPKTSEHRLELDGRTFVFAGVAKGSGMIHPNMATMLAIWATNLELTPRALDHVLREAVERSFHEITVDGDTSTNDAVVALAGGAGGEVLDLGHPALGRVVETATSVCRDLAEAIVLDGEGRTRVMEILVTGAASERAARDMARAIATSSLVKTALAGGDPNWGRILAAAANAGHPLDEDTLSLRLQGELVFAEGQPLPDVDVSEAFARERVRAELVVGEGPGAGRMLTTDLTHRYVEINADYRT